MADYSFSPQFATIRSESPLAGMRPVTSIQHTALSFREDKPFQIRSAGEEKVALGAIEGIQKGVGDALKGVTAAYVGEREKKEKAAESILEHGRAVEIANIKAQKTPEEIAYEKLRMQNIQSLIKERGGDKKPRNVYPSGVFSGQPKKPLEVVEPLLPDEEVIPSKPDLKALPDEDIIPLSSLSDIPMPQVVTSVPKNTLATTIPEDIFAEPKRKTYAGFLTNPQADSNQILPQAIGSTPIENLPPQENLVPPEMQVLLASSSGGIPDVGGKDVLSAQTQASAMTPVVPQTPQQMSEFAKLAKQERTSPTSYRRQWIEDVIAKEEATMPAPMPEMASIRPDDLVSNAYESWQDAEQANKMLAKMLPDYDVNPVKQETVDGQTYYVIEPPERKEKAKKDDIPEGFYIEDAKMEDGKMTYKLKPKPEVIEEIAALQQPMESIDGMLATIRQIKEIYKGVSPGVGGAAASTLRFVPGSDAWNVDLLLKNIQGNIAFKTLADMRKASPTGGALGSVSEMELQMLANSLGAIQQGLEEKYFTENINRIEKNIKETKSKIQNAVKNISERSQKFTPIQDAPKYKEGDTATNPQTGQKMIFKSGQWKIVK